MTILIIFQQSQCIYSLFLSELHYWFFSFLKFWFNTHPGFRSSLSQYALISIICTAIWNWESSFIGKFLSDWILRHYLPNLDDLTASGPQCLPCWVWCIQLLGTILIFVTILKWRLEMKEFLQKTSSSCSDPQLENLCFFTFYKPSDNQCCL